MKQIEMLGGLPAIGGDVNPVLHQQGIFRMLDRDMRTIAHHDRERNERLG